jgi:adenine C2-methylase RlmN of 23S rRNA A2503 and tRNA A37
VSLVDLAALPLPELTQFVTALGEKPFRSKQLYTWVHQRGAVSFDEMTDLSKGIAGALKASCAADSALTKDSRAAQRRRHHQVPVQDARRSR